MFSNQLIDALQQKNTGKCIAIINAAKNNAEEAENAINLTDAVFLAIEHGDLNVLKHLADNFEINFSSLWKQNQLPIHAATASKQTNILLYLLEKDPASIVVADTQENSILHLLAAQNDGYTLSKLEQANISLEKIIKFSNKKGQTPLHIACQNSDVEIAKTLIAMQADPNVKDITGVSPSQQMSVYFRDANYAKQFPLHAALKSVNSVNEFFNCVTLESLKEGVNAIDNEGNTLLHLATLNNNGDMVSLLVNQLGADINISNFQQKTAAELVNEDNQDIISFLLRTKYTRFLSSAGRSALGSPLVTSALANVGVGFVTAGFARYYGKNEQAANDKPEIPTVDENTLTSTVTRVVAQELTKTAIEVAVNKGCVIS